jgi:site-specific DNA recombinase
MDAAEAERTSERARAKQKELAESGRHNGPRPFGWDIVGSSAEQRLTVNRAEAAVLKECVDRVLASEAAQVLDGGPVGMADDVDEGLAEH